MSIPQHVDVLIVGGGPVGGALALGLESCGLRVLVAEARMQPTDDPRALAVSHASVQALQQFGLALSDDACAITSIHVSQARAWGRVRLAAKDLALPVLGYVLRYGGLAQAIHQRLLVGRAHYLTGTTVTAIQSLAHYAVVSLQSGGRESVVTAQLVVLAEGGHLLAGLGVEQVSKDYRQQALLAEIVSNKPHQHVAYERFALDGPIALLPRGRGDDALGRYAVVWTRPNEDPLAVHELGDQDFLAQLQSRVGDRAGRFVDVGARARFPLRLKWAKNPYARRVAVVGNAAQTLHPVAGQGFNLGLRDVQTMVRLVRQYDTRALGDVAMLQRYAQLRRQDSRLTIGFTDGLMGLFGHDLPMIRHARAVGMMALDNIAPLRRGFASRMVFGS